YDQQIIDQSGIHGGDSLIETMRKKDVAVSHIVDELPQVSNSTIEVTGFNDIIIQVKEFNTVAYIADDSSYLRVLENGAVLDDVYSVSDRKSTRLNSSHVSISYAVF